MAYFIEEVNQDLGADGGGNWVIWRLLTNLVPKLVIKRLDNNNKNIPAAPN